MPMSVEDFARLCLRRGDTHALRTLCQAYDVPAPVLFIVECYFAAERARAQAEEEVIQGWVDRLDEGEAHLKELGVDPSMIRCPAHRFGTCAMFQQEHEFLARRQYGCPHCGPPV